jgi:hypothetical protein
VAAHLEDRTLLASGARTSTQTLPAIQNYELFDGIELCLDLTAFTTAAALTLTLEEFIPGANTYVPVLSSAVISAVGRTFLRMFPGGPEVTNQARNAFLPRDYRVVITHGNGNSCTYSVSASLTRLER